MNTLCGINNTKASWSHMAGVTLGYFARRFLKKQGTSVFMATFTSSGKSNAN